MVTIAQFVDTYLHVAQCIHSLAHSFLLSLYATPVQCLSDDDDVELHVVVSTAFCCIECVAVCSPNLGMYVM